MSAAYTLLLRPLLLLCAFLLARPVAGGTPAWVSIGPSGQSNSDATAYTAVGRVNALAFDPATPDVLYAGTAAGGLWRSADRGGSWTPLCDHKGLPNLGVGAVAVAPDHTIYVGVGDPFYNFNHAVQTSTGGGVFKSTDSGLHWSQTGTGGCDSLSSQATKILIDPSNANIVWASTWDGLYRSTDGGNCWRRLLSGKASDVAMKPDDPATLYVHLSTSTGQLMKTTNGHDASPSFLGVLLPIIWSSGNPRGLFAVAPADPQKVYLLQAESSFIDIFRSGDGGNSWVTLVNCGPSDSCPCSGQCDFGAAVLVNPANAMQVFYGEVSTHVSNDGCMTFALLGSGRDIHADVHAFAFAPDDLNTLYAATDGGVYTRALSPPAAPWQAKNNGLATTLAEELSIAPSDPSVEAIGAWDNGTLHHTGGAWVQIGGGDGFNVSIDASSSDVVFFDCNAGSGTCGSTDEILRKDKVGNTDFGAAPGFVCNPYKPGEFFVVRLNGTQGLKVTEDGNSTSTPAYYCVDPRPQSPVGNGVEFGSDGWYYIVGTDGSLWQEHIQITPGSFFDCSQGTSAVDVHTIAPNGDSYDAVAANPFDPNSLYALTCNTGNNRITKLSHSGGGWTSMSLEAPDVTITSIAADPTLNNIVYAGTAHGLYVGMRGCDGHYSWALEPTVPDGFIFAIVPHRNGSGYTGVMRLSTYGRGVWERVTPTDLFVGAPVLYVPGQYSTVRAAYNAACDYSILSVATGAYHEAPLPLNQKKHVRLVTQGGPATISQ